MVTAPCRACRAVAVISRTSCSKLRPGSCTASAARPCTCAWVGITRPGHRPRRSRRSGRRPRRPAPSRGRWAARPPPRPRGGDRLERPGRSTAGVPGRPRPSTPAPGEHRASPGPAATTTMAPRRVVRLLRAADICSAKCVTRTRYGRPARIPASMAAPTSSTWTWTLNRPSPPTTTRESPSGASVRRSWESARPGVEEVHHLVGGAVRGEVVRGHRYRDVVLPIRVLTGVGRRPVSAGSAASRMTLRPRPPASTTPASRSAWSCSGVRLRASRAASRRG